MIRFQFQGMIEQQIVQGSALEKNYNRGRRGTRERERENVWRLAISLGIVTEVLSSSSLERERERICSFGLRDCHG